MRLLLLLIALVAIVPAAPASAAKKKHKRTPKPTPGLVATLPMSDADVAAIAHSGAKVARFFMYVHDYDDNGFRSAVDRLARIHVKPLFVVVGDVHNPAGDIGGYAAFVRARAAEFRGHVAAWEIWNEPDAAGWWAGASPVDGPSQDASAYTRLLIAAHGAVRSVDRRTPVLMGGLTGNNFHFLESVYANGGRGSFDAVAVHTDTACNILSPYSYLRDLDGRINQFSFLGFREVHRTMAAHGDARKKIWMSEMGWSTSSRTCDVGRWAGQKAGGVSLANQAHFLREALHCVTRSGYVANATVFKLRDGAADVPSERFGLMAPGGQAKPAFRTLQSFVKHGDTLRGGCGDFSGPRLRVLAPQHGFRFSKDLVIRAVARDGAGVPRITLLADGHKIRNFTSSRAPRRLSGTIDWQGAKRLSPGRHRITVLALDRSRNVSRRTVVVTKLPRR